MSGCFFFPSSLSRFLPSPGLTLTSVTLAPWKLSPCSGIPACPPSPPLGLSFALDVPPFFIGPRPSGGFQGLSLSNFPSSVYLSGFLPPALCSFQSSLSDLVPYCLSSSFFTKYSFSDSFPLILFFILSFILFFIVPLVLLGIPSTMLDRSIARQHVISSVRNMPQI